MMFFIEIDCSSVHFPRAFHIGAYFSPHRAVRGIVLPEQGHDRNTIGCLFFNRFGRFFRRFARRSGKNLLSISDGFA